MQQINYPSKEDWDEILARPVIENKLLNTQVSKILREVKAGGDKTLKKFAKKFDGVVLKSIKVNQNEIDSAEGLMSATLKDSILVAANNIRKFHSVQIVPISKIETTEGVFLLAKILANRKGRAVYSGWICSIVLNNIDVGHSCTAC